MVLLKGVLLDNFSLGGFGGLERTNSAIFTLEGCSDLESTDFG